ncbi:MAG: hypothetical protein GX614_09795 [Sandaracinaceae bacterium]|nr:hypothetical protein [Sandaracinaceae bacterium]
MIASFRRTLLPFFLLSLVSIGGLFFALIDASIRREDERKRVDEKRALVSLLPSAELFFSSSARWLRHPSLSEPMAPFADTPSGFDVDPAGALQPPLSLHREIRPKVQPE